MKYFTIKDGQNQHKSQASKSLKIVMIVFLIPQYITDTKQSVLTFYKMPLCKWMFKEENSKPGDFTRPLQKLLNLFILSQFQMVTILLTKALNCTVYPSSFVKHGKPLHGP